MLDEASTFFPLPAPAAGPLAAGVLHPALALAGVAAVAIPIVIHFLNRRRFKTVQWAAMEFLLQAMRRNRRRVRFESLLLLVTRCLVVGLLGLALARPFGCADTALARAAGREAGLHVFVIDNSASMAYRHERPDADTHLARAKQLGAALVGRLGGGSEQVAVVTAAAPAAGVISSPSFDLAAATAAIENLKQTMRGTDLAGALAEAVRIADDVPAGTPKTLHVLTDSTAASLAGSERLAEVSGEAASRYQIVWHSLAAPGQSNQAVTRVRSGDPLVRRGFDASFFAAHQRFGGVPTETTLAWRLDGNPTGGTASVTPAAEAAEAATGDASIQNALQDGRPHVLEAALTGGDAFPFDDARRRVVEEVRQLPVLLVEGQRVLGGSAGMGGSGAFLSLALQPGQDAGYVSVTRISDLELAGRALAPYRAVVLAGVGNIAEPTAQALADFARNGGTVIIWLGEAVGSDNYNSVLLPRGLLPGPLVRRVTATDESLIGFDFSPQSVHPYLAAFRGAARSGLDVPAIRQYWQVDLPTSAQADVVLRYLPPAPSAAGDPAVVTWGLGDGRVLLVTTAAGDPDWTLLPLKDNYLAFVHELLGHAVGETAGGGVAWQTLTVGDRLVVPPAAQVSGEPALTGPDGQPVPLRREIRADGVGVWQSGPLEFPGVYQLATGERTLPVAVNLAAAESDLRPLDEAGVVAALGDVDLTWSGDELPTPAALGAEQDRADFGWALLLAVLLLAGFECFIAMRFGRHRR